MSCVILHSCYCLFLFLISKCTYQPTTNNRLISSPISQIRLPVIHLPLLTHQFSPGKDRYSAEPENMSSLMTDSGIKVSSRTNSFEIENLLKTAEQVTGFCRSPVETRKSSPTGSVVSNTSQTLLTPSRQLTDAEKLRKVIMELVDTERAYVKVNYRFFITSSLKVRLSVAV